MDVTVEGVGFGLWMNKVLCG